jgi:hypothetical protein
VTDVLRPDQTRTGLGLVQHSNNRYLSAVSGCCEAEIETVVSGGSIVLQRCSGCRKTLKTAPLTWSKLDMSRQTEREKLQDFVINWTGFEIGEFQVNIEWDFTK